MPITTEEHRGWTAGWLVEVGHTQLTKITLIIGVVMKLLLPTVHDNYHISRRGTLFSFILPNIDVVGQVVHTYFP